MRVVLADVEHDALAVVEHEFRTRGNSGPSCLSIMLTHGDDGHIVSTASVAGLISGPLQIPYNVRKYGVVALSEGLHRELALIESKIKVSALCPGLVHTRIMESERSARTYDTATG